MSNSLFVLTNQYLQLAHQLADGDFDAATVADTIRWMTTSLNQKTP